MKIYAASRRSEVPKYEIAVSDDLQLTDDEYEYVVDTIYITLAPYNGQLNLFCKKLEFYREGYYYIKLYSKYKLAPINESTPRKDWKIALKVLLAKVIAEIPEYVEEFKDELSRNSLYKSTSGKLSAYKLCTKLIENKFGIKLKTIKDRWGRFIGAYYIDELPCSLDEYKKFLADIYTKYKFNESPSHGFNESPDMMWCTWTANGREFIYLNDFLSRANLYYVFDKEKNDYVKL